MMDALSASCERYPAKTAGARLVLSAVVAGALMLPSLGCGMDGGGPENETGALEIRTSTTGDDLDPNGYTISIDNAERRSVGLNGTIIFPGLPAKRHQVSLGGIASNCSTSGNETRTVTVRLRDTTSTRFRISCVASGGDTGQTITGIRFDFSSHRRGADGTDNWPVTWSDDGHQYAFGGDGRGFCGFSEKRSWMAARIEGAFDSYRAVDRIGGDCAEFQTSLDGKTHGAPISVGGVIYFWFTPGSGTKGYESSSLYRSIDKLATTEETTVTFTNASHSIAYMGFVNHGRDNDHGDGFVYAIGVEPEETEDIFTDQHDRILLLRVPEGRIEDQSEYEWFTGFDEDGDPSWGEQADRAATYTEVGSVGPFPQMTYVPGLDRYVLTVETGQSTSDMLVLEAANPWGPWNEVVRRENWGTGIQNTVFQWQFAPKWFRNGGRSFTLIFSGDEDNDSWNTVNGSFQADEGS